MGRFTCKDLKGKSFETKTEMFSALKGAKEEITALKKSVIKFSDAIGFTVKGEGTTKEHGSGKLQYGDYAYPVINTANYLDKHGDVHIPGLWDTSAEAQQGKIYLIINHDLSIGNVISYPRDVDILIKTMSWKSLGAPYDGDTQALIFKSRITEKSNPAAYYAYRDGEAIQHSIRMSYVKIELAINDGSDDFRGEKAIFDKYIGQIANKEYALEQGYFWAILEAKIYKEGSAVLFGSNDITPTLYDLETKDFQSSTSTQKGERDSLLFNANYY